MSGVSEKGSYKVSSVPGAVRSLLGGALRPGGPSFLIVGALLGGWLGQTFLGVGQTSGFNIPTLLTAIVGTLILLFLYRMVAGRGTSTTRRT